MAATAVRLAETRRALLAKQRRSVARAMTAVAIVAYGSHCYVGNPFLKSLTRQDAPRAAAVAFAHTEEHFTENVLGRAAFTRGRPGPFRRRDNTGSRAARVADYAGALARHHTVVPIIHEVFGGWG